MKNPFGNGKLLLALVIVVGGAAYWQRTPLLAWHYFRQLSLANEQDRAVWVNRLVGLDSAVKLAALERLFADGPVCGDGEAVLIGLVRSWGIADAKTLAVMDELLKQYPSFSEPGKDGALRVACASLEQGKDGVAENLLQPAGDLLVLGTREGPRPAVLRLALSLGEHVGLDTTLLKNLALAGVKSAEPEVRTLASRLFLQPPLDKDTAFQADVLPLLRDGSAQVRRAALLVVAGSRELVAEDDLLPLLHDPDPQLQRLCEKVLRSRGLQDDHLVLARLISDENPVARLRVLDHLDEAVDLEPGVWLRRLCQDSSPAVRAAAVRASASQPQGDLVEVLTGMARTDPSPTVRQLAAHYLRHSPR